MKKIILFLLAALTAAGCVPVFSARAEEEPAPAYARVMQEGVYFYRYADESAGLFILPRTYFVRIVGEAGEFYRVRYLETAGEGGAVEGYCKADEVTPVDYIPETPYLDYSLTVTYRADYSGVPLPDSFLTEYTVTAAYYGGFSYGSATSYYVLLEGKFGYVPASACSIVDYPENTEHMEAEVPPAEEPAPSPRTFGAAGVVLACVLAAAALGALYFLFRPAKAKREDAPAYDEAEDVF